jgi:hypothetical protein
MIFTGDGSRNLISGVISSVNDSRNQISGMVCNGSETRNFVAGEVFTEDHSSFWVDRSFADLKHKDD